MTTTPDEALAWLRSQGRVCTTTAALASAWGWSRSRVGSRLKRWAAEGRIRTRSGPKGTLIDWAGDAAFEPAAPSCAMQAQEGPQAAYAAATHGETGGALIVPPPSRPAWSTQLDLLDAMATTYVSVRVASRLHVRSEALTKAAFLVAEEQPRLPAAAGSAQAMPVPAAPPESGAVAERPAAAPPVLPLGNEAAPRARTSFVAPPFSLRQVSDAILVLAIASLTAVMLYVSIRLNAWYAESRGATAEARQLWVWASMSAEFFEAAMALSGARLSCRRQWGAAALAYATCAVIMVFATLAAVGFAATNVADATAERSAIVESRRAFEAELERKREELQRLPPTRPAGVLEAALQSAQPLVPPAVWRATKGCTDVTAPQSGVACAEVVRLRQEQAAAERREILDRDLAETRRKLDALPSVTSADPQAEAAATLANWITRGAAGVTALDIQLLFLVLVVLIVRLPVSVGPIVAVALWRPAGSRPAFS